MLDLKNEFIMSPIKIGYSIGDGKVTDRHIKIDLDILELLLLNLCI